VQRVTCSPGSHCVGTPCQPSIVTAAHFFGREPVSHRRQSSLPRLTRSCRRSEQANSAFRPARYSLRSLPFKAGVIRPTVLPGRFRQSAGQYSSGQLCRRRRNRVNSTYRPVRHRLPWWVCQPTLVAVPPSVRLRPLHVYAATDLPSPDPHPVVDGHPPPSA